MIRWIHSILGGFQGQHFGLQFFCQSNYLLLVCKNICFLRKQVLHLAYKSCISFTKLAFYLQIVHFRLQTCVSITKVAFRFTNATFRITIQHFTIGYRYFIKLFYLNIRIKCQFSNFCLTFPTFRVIYSLNVIREVAFVKRNASL